MSRVDLLFQERVTLLEEWRRLDPFQMEEAERVIEEAHELGVAGLDKLAEESGGLQKFRDLVSEVRFSVDFAKSGGSVTLLHEHYFGKRQGQKGADLQVVYEDGFELLVEVRRGSGGQPGLTEALDLALKENGLLFRVQYVLAMEMGREPGLSRPGVSWSERQRQEELVEETVARIVERLRSASPDEDGEISVRGSRFIYGPTPASEGYVAGGVLGTGWVRSNLHSEVFLRDVASKARNPRTFRGRWTSVPYVVAYDAEEFSLSHRDTFSALIGSLCFYAARSDEDRAMVIAGEVRNYPPLIQEKMNDERWGEAMRLWGFHDQGSTFFSSFGVFHSEEWASWVDGVLVRHPARQIRQWLPNPWGRNSSERLMRLLPIYDVRTGEDEY